VILFHRDLGGAGKQPIILLHGMLGSSRNWQTTGAALAADFHVFALDLRNHGSSPHAPEMSYDAMMRDVLAWMDEQGIASATVLGHSMGGKVAMLLACREPTRMSKLVVVDIAPKNYFWPAHRARFAAMNELDVATLHSRAEAETRLETRIPNWAMRKFLTTNLERGSDGRWSWQINLPVLTAAVDQLEKNPLRSDDRFAGQTRFIAGGDSAYIEPPDHVLIRQHFPAAEIIVLPNVGHNPHMEAREAFVRSVHFP